jgi:hypothetical protein
MPRVAKAEVKTTRAKSVKTTKSESGMVIFPELTVRDPETKYTGTEPIFMTQPEIADRQSVLIKSFNWYGRFFDRKMAKQQLINWATEVGKYDVRALARAGEEHFVLPVCWLARMNLRGLVMTETEQARVDTMIAGILTTVKPQTKIEQNAEPKNTRPNVQEIMRERATDAAGVLEGCFDDFITNGSPGIDEVNPVSILTERGILAQHVAPIIDSWKQRREEFVLVQTGKDAQLKEGYSQYTKMGIRNIIKFCDAVISGLNGYITVKRAAVKPRARKPVSPERRSAKVKYLKTFKDAALKLDLTSIHPSKIIGATEVWAYDSEKRKLHFYTADSLVGTLGIKGTSITGFDAVNSGVKTLRQPGEVIKQLLSAGKPAARKIFKEIKAVHAQAKGRTNSALVILRVA